MNLRKIIQYLLIIMVASLGIAAWIASEFDLYNIFTNNGIQLTLDDSRFGKSFMQKESMEVDGRAENMRIDGISENIIINVTDTQEIKATLSGNGSSFNKPKLIMASSGSLVSIKVEYPKTGPMFNFPGSYSLEVEIPSKEIMKKLRTLKVEQVSGNIDVVGFDIEQINAKSTSGNVMIDSIAQEMILKSVSGNIILKTNHPEMAKLDLKTVSGKIDLNYTGAPQVGDEKKINVQNDGVNQITCESISGNIEINQ